MKYRKKPVVVEAFHFTSDKRMDNFDWPEWLNRAWNMHESESGAFFCEGGETVFIRTLEGVHAVTPGDYIIQGIKGELYPCKPDIFEATYEAI